jgi:hypothetical protein
MIDMAKKPPRKRAPAPQKLDPSMKRALPLKHVVPPELLSTFANIFLIQSDGPEFHLYFFQSQMPLIIPEAPGSLEEFQALKEIPARCVSKISMSSARMPALIEALTTNYQNWQKQQEILAAEAAQAATGNNHAG